MDEVESALARWKESLPINVDAGALHARSPVAHKWKAPFRSLILRESVFWRLHDLLNQSHVLHKSGHTLGARILLRSAFETLAVLIYLNQITERLLNGGIAFGEFQDKTAVLLLGSRNGSTSHKSLNIVTILEKCENRYPGISKLYADLSESAHPNFEGTCIGYSTVDVKQYVTTFENRWRAMYAGEHVSAVLLCIAMFEHEYNEIWASRMPLLERWLEENDTELENSKPAQA